MDAYHSLGTHICPAPGRCRGLFCRREKEDAESSLSPLWDAAKNNAEL